MHIIVFVQHFFSCNSPFFSSLKFFFFIYLNFLVKGEFITSKPNLTMRALPFLKSIQNNGNNSPTLELKNALFSPTSLIRTPTFRTKRSMAMLYSFPIIFIICVFVLTFGNSHIHHSTDWLKHMLTNRELAYVKTAKPQVSPSSAVTPSGSNSVNSSLSGNGSENVTLAGNVKHGSKGYGNENMSSSNKTIPAKGKSKKASARLKTKRWVEMMSKCDIFDGKWVKDDSPPLYEPGSCPHIDEPFNCYENGRPDNGYERFRWQPNHCDIPRLDGQRMLNFLKGKRIVYVGDSLNRNMWESMVCLLRNAVKDKSRVFEASGRVEFKKEGAYSFLFPDYNCSVEYIRSAFLVQESEMPISNGSKKETLRLDLVEDSSNTYKDADVLVFNTGHWWTHEKTSEGKGYYQEGDHVHEKLEVTEAFRRAMNTWSKWIKANIDPKKTHVFFRGYSLSHFSEGEWYSGGKCDDTREPVKDEKDLMHLDKIYPPIPQMLEESLSGMQSPVHYLNVTSLTNYRRDAHPSIYRKPNMTEEEKKTFLKHQDCSHWCLPGVPDTWNQLLFAKLLLRHKQKQLQL